MLLAWISTVTDSNLTGKEKYLDIHKHASYAWDPMFWESYGGWKQLHFVAYIFTVWWQLLITVDGVSLVGLFPIKKKKKSQGFESSLTQSCSVESVLHSIDSTFLLHCDKNLSLTSAIGFSREWKLKEKLFNGWGQFRL